MPKYNHHRETERRPRYLKHIERRHIKRAPNGLETEN